MRKEFLTVLVATAVCALPSGAKPRAEVAMRHTVDGLLSPEANMVKAVSSDCYRVYENPNGGFVVLSTDDLLPDILAYSPCGNLSGDATSKNPGLLWWLRAVEEASRDIVKGNRKHAPIKPDTDRFAERIAPMITAQWGQEEPFFNFCPVGSSAGSMGGIQEHCLTGCVATAIAQIMHYHKFPEHGQNYHLIYFPFGDTSGQKLEVDFSESYYDWNNMLDSYQKGYSEEEANAVALLMYDCGVASNMVYRTTGSAAFTKDAAEGLVKYFGYASTTTVENRVNYTDAEWMDKVYAELNAGRPIFYGANDVAAGGHAFVIDGYNSDGMVHVNWGWEGKDNGYYDISILNPGSYQFSMNQDAIMGIVPDKVMETIKENLSFTEPGSLAAYFGADERMRVKELAVSGPLNSDDIRSLREMAGVDADGNPTDGILKTLDLSEATIMAGGEPYFTAGNLSTSDDRIGDFMFAGCRALQFLKLPGSVKSIGDGAFLDCMGLKELEIPLDGEREYIREGNLLFNPSKTELICALPFDVTAFYEMPATLKNIRKHAFHGASKLVNIILPSGLLGIGESGFEGCRSLRQIKLFAVEPPVAAHDAFKDVTKHGCVVMVRAGSKGSYEKAEGWCEFKGTYMVESYPINFDNIQEFGTTIKVTNAYKIYGDPNPAKFGYKITGDKLSGGTPVMTCDADEFSPVGEYVILIERGTITDEAVDFEDGILFVMPAMLTVMADDAVREQGQPNPEFTMTFDGFRNGEDESVIDEFPVVTTLADESSPIGDYTLFVSGGSALNYDFDFYNGVLHVTEAAAVGSMKAETVSGSLYDIYGRRLPEGSRPISGIYILDGKKIIIKQQ